MKQHPPLSNAEKQRRYRERRKAERERLRNRLLGSGAGDRPPEAQRWQRD